jgi:hypothetical protein
LAAVDINGGISSAWTAVANFVPKLVAFLIILVIGWVIAKVLSKVVATVLNKVGFDRVVERGGIKTMLEKSKYDASTLIAKVVYYAIVLIALEVAFGVFGPNPISTVLTAIVAWLPKLIVAMLIVVIVGAIAKVVKDLVSGALSGLSYGRMLGTIASVFIWGLGIIAALNQMGIATAVTTPVLITVLATIGGVVVVGMGGGLIKPMQQRWEGWINRAEGELPSAKAHSEAFQRGQEDAMRSGDHPTEQLPQQTIDQAEARAAAGPRGGASRSATPQGGTAGWESRRPGGQSDGPGSSMPPDSYR